MVTITVDHPGKEPLRYYEYPTRNLAIRSIQSLTRCSKKELEEFLTKPGKVLTSPNGQVWVIGISGWEE